MNLTKLRYTNCHLHSHFSNLKMLDAYWTIDQIIARCKKIWYTAVPLTDHGSVSGHIQLIRKCKEEWLKPIPGCEMYVVDDLEEMKKARDMVPAKKSEEQETDEYQTYKEDIKAKARRKMHFNVLPKNQAWLLAIWELVTQSWTDWMYFKPSIDWKALEKHKENLWLWTACESGPLGRSLEHEKFLGTRKIEEIKFEFEEEKEELENELFLLKKNLVDWSNLELDDKILKVEETIREKESNLEKQTKEITIEWKKKAEESLKKKLLELKEMFWENLYVEMIPIYDERANWIYLLTYKVAKELWVLIVATNDSHYPEKKDSKYQDVLYCTNLRRSNSTIMFNDPERKRYSPELFYIHSAEEMFHEMVSCFPTIPEEDIYEMINNSQIIVDWTELVVEPKVPAVAYREINDIEGTKWTNLYAKLVELLEYGWKFREFDKLDGVTQKKYSDRMRREIWVISNKGYIDYFLIMRDIMNWCDTDRPFIENYDKWYELNWEHFYPWKEKKELYQELLNNTNLLSLKTPIATWIARGSAGWSIVTYLLQITNINPMPWKLLFERFLDYTRGDVYYKLNFESYSKPQFLKDYPEENLERIRELEKKYKPLLKEKKELLIWNKKTWVIWTNSWYHWLQFTRENWLLMHNQKFSREKEYFYTILDKYINWEIKQSNTNSENSLLAWNLGITTKEPNWDFVVNLTDIPDIDADFEDSRRDLVYLYLIHRYGIHNSCRISTYGEIKDKSGLDMLVRIFWEKDPYDEKWEKTKPEILKDIKDLKERIEEYKKENDIKSTAAIKWKDVKYFLDVYNRGEDWKILEPLEINKDENWNIIYWDYYWAKYCADKYSWIWEFWESMFWQVIAMWQHAAWMIVHNKPIVQYWAMYSNKDKQTWEMIPVIAWDKVESESMGLMKLDILWLNTCWNLREVNELVEKRHWFKHHWQRIPKVFEDEKTIDLLHKGDVSWLFQLEGGTMLWLTKHISPNNLEDVVMINAWGRPGPLEYIHSLKYKEKKEVMMKAKENWIEDITLEKYIIPVNINWNEKEEELNKLLKRNKEIKIENEEKLKRNQILEKEYKDKLLKIARKIPLEKREDNHEMFIPFYFNNEIYKEITKERYWLIIYQEDIMAISRRMCLYDDKMVWKIRKMVWKATYGWLDDLEWDFIWRLINNAGLTPENAKNLWDYIKGFWTYCFNKAHAEAYAMLAWIQGYYKANYPLEFYAWTLKTLPENSEDKINLLLKDYKIHWYDLLAPDINLSKTNFEINKDLETWKEAIRVWLLYIKWLGWKQAEEIIRKQPFEGYKDFIKKIDKRIVNAWVRQICKDIWLFNNVWGAPLIEEKLVPAIEFIEFIWDFPEVFQDLINNYSHENLNDLYLQFWVKEDKLPIDLSTKNNDTKLTLDFYKKIITKIKSKINSLANWIEKEKINKSEIKIDIWFKEILLTLKDKIDLLNKENLIELKEELNIIKKNENLIFKYLIQMNSDYDKLLKQQKLLAKVKWKKENSEKGIREWITKDEKNIISNLCNLIWLENPTISKENIKEEKDLIEKQLLIEIDLIEKNSMRKMEKDHYEKYLEIEKIKEDNKKYKEIIESKLIEIYNERMINLLKEMSIITKDIIKSLNIDQWLHIIKIDNEKAINHCPIMLNVDLSKYKRILEHFKPGWYLRLKQIDDLEDIKFWITVWMIRTFEVKTWDLRETQWKVFCELMVWEKISRLFINWIVYKKYQEFFENLKVADTVIITFKKSNRFPVIAVDEIFDLPTFFNRVVENDLSKGPLTLLEKKLLN